MCLRHVLPPVPQNSSQWLDMELSGELEKYREANPTHKSMMVRILKVGYSALQLIHFFTSGADEVRGWTIKDGWLAPQAAGGSTQLRKFSCRGPLSLLSVPLCDLSACLSPSLSCVCVFWMHDKGGEGVWERRLCLWLSVQCVVHSARAMIVHVQ